MNIVALCCPVCFRGAAALDAAEHTARPPWLAIKPGRRRTLPRVDFPLTWFPWAAFFEGELWRVSSPAPVPERMVSFHGSENFAEIP
jgi:hypothetical protein